jgi:hypothetical protein
MPLQFILLTLNDGDSGVREVKEDGWTYHVYEFKSLV